MQKLLAKKLTDNAILPFKKREDDEGYDIYSNHSVVLEPNKVTKVHTGIVAWAVDTLSCDTKYWLQIEGRSGLAAKGIFPIGGVVDNSYTGELMVLLVNMSGEDYLVEANDKIAQLVIRQHMNFVVAESQELPESDRGEKGFGSSGK